MSTAYSILTQGAGPLSANFSNLTFLFMPISKQYSKTEMSPQPGTDMRSGNGHPKHCDASFRAGCNMSNLAENQKLVIVQVGVNSKGR